MKLTLLLIPLLLFSLAIPVKALIVGNQGIGAMDTASDNQIMFNDFTLNIPDGYLAKVSSVTVYLNNTVGSNFRLAIYNSAMVRVALSEETNIATLDWVEVPINANLLNGTYYFALAIEDGDTHYYKEDGIGSVNGRYLSQYALDGVFAATNLWGNYMISIYATYEIAPVDDHYSGGSLYLGIGCFAIIGISLILFKLRLGVVGLVWGIFGMAIAASLVGNQDVPFYPFLTIGLALVGMLLTFYSGYEMRGV